MIINSVKIRQFMGIEALNMTFNAPLTIISGPNEARKSSLRDAILWGFTGEARGLKTHKDQASMIHDGGKAAEVEIQASNISKPFFRRKTPKSPPTVTGEIPNIGLAPAILFDPYSFLHLGEAQRREVLFQAIPGLNPTRENVIKGLLKALAPGQETQIDKALWQVTEIVADVVLSHGFPAAEKEAVTKRREAKRVKDALSDIKEPKQTITIDEKEYDIPTLNFQAIEGTLKELSAAKDSLQRQKGGREARARRLSLIRTQLDQSKPLVAPPTDEIKNLELLLDDLNKSIEEVTLAIKQANTRQETFPATCPIITLAPTSCPNAGQTVGQAPAAPGVIEALQQNKAGFAQKASQTIQLLQDARRRVEEYKMAVMKKADMEEELRQLEGESADLVDLDAEIAIRERRIQRGREFQTVIRQYESDMTRFKEAAAKLADCDQEIMVYDVLQKALAPDGIPSQMIAEALGPFNELLTYVAGVLFRNRPLVLTEDLAIELSEKPFQLLSKSEQYRVGVAFQYVLAQLVGARLLMIDEADILTPIRLRELLNFLLGELGNFDQIIVFFSADTPQVFRSDARVASWWLENGEIKEIKYGEAAGGTA